MKDVPPLDERERGIGLALAAVAAVAFVVLDHASPVPLAIGAVMAAGIAFGAFRRQRVLVAVFAFVTTFGPWRWLVIAGAPFAVYSLWVLSGATRAERRNESSSDRRRTRDRSVGS